MTALLVMAVSAISTVFGTHAAADWAAVKMRLAWHRRRTRRDGRMLRRALTQPTGGGWR